MSIKGKEYITLSTVAKELDCSVRTVQHWAQVGKIESEKLFGRLLIDRAYFEEWKQRNIVKKSAG
jgi:excisionase family DNA binding protein